MSRDRAAYMREYRARKRLEARGLRATEDITLTISPTGQPPMEFRAKDYPALVQGLSQVICDMAAEVGRLQAELATRPIIGVVQPPVILEAGFNTRPFTPAPKVRRRG